MQKLIALGIFRLLFYPALLLLMLPTCILSAGEPTNSDEMHRTGTSLNSDLITPVFGLYYLDFEIPIDNHIDLTVGIVYQELHKWLMPDWSENRAGYVKLGSIYFFSKTKKGWLIYTDAFVGWMVLDTYKNEPPREFKGAEYIHQVMGGYRFFLSNKIFVTPLVGMLYGYSWALADADRVTTDEIIYSEVGPALELTVGFKF